MQEPRESSARVSLVCRGDPCGFVSGNDGRLGARPARPRRPNGGHLDHRMTSTRPGLYVAERCCVSITAVVAGTATSYAILVFHIIKLRR